MFTPINSIAIYNPANSDAAALNGLDLLSSIQILLVQDYDNQLQSLGNQIKGTTRLKQAYRQDIESLQKLMMRPTEKKGDPEEDCIFVSPDEYSTLNKEYQHYIDFGSGEVATNAQTLSVSGSGVKKIEGDTVDGHRLETGYWISKNSLEKRVEVYNSKLTTLNEQSELMSLGVQSLTNQRKIAFETISNLVNKQHDSLAGIIRNMNS